MAEEEGEGVAIVPDGITLKAISLLLVGDMELDSALSLKAEHLLVDADPLPGINIFAALLLSSSRRRCTFHNGFFAVSFLASLRKSNMHINVGSASTFGNLE
jgi:hypothetical protein